MEEWIEFSCKELLTNREFGFRKKYSTRNAILYLNERVRQELNENKFFICALLDLSKAFNTINKIKLFKKKKCLGVNYSSVKILSSLLSGRMQRVIVNDET